MPRRAIALASSFLALIFFALPVMGQTANDAPMNDGLVIIAVCFLLGILLLLAEIFLIPGFGVTGIGGFALIGYSCYAAFSAYGTRTGALVSLAMVLLTIVVGGSSLKVLFHSKAGDALIHRGAIDGTGRPVDRTLDPDLWIGRKGTARTDLRPAGQVDFDGEILEVRADGGLVETGTTVEVCRLESNRPIVRTIRA